MADPGKPPSFFSRFWQRAKDIFQGAAKPTPSPRSPPKEFIADRPLKRNFFSGLWQRVNDVFRRPAKRRTRKVRTPPFRAPHPPHISPEKWETIMDVRDGLKVARVEEGRMDEGAFQSMQILFDEFPRDELLDYLESPDLKDKQ